MDKGKTTREYQPRKLEKLNLLDNFLFQEMMSQEATREEFGSILLQTILGRPIQKIRIIPQNNVLGVNTDRHGIRMDAYIEEIPKTDEPEGEDADTEKESEVLEADIVPEEVVPNIYDVEPNKVYEKGKKLPRRMRYYHGIIDTKLLSTGTAYDKLPNVVIIVILPYDPFDKNRMVYTVQNQCIEDPSVDYDDGAKKIFLYTKGTVGNPSQNLKDMLKYIEETTEANVTNPDIAKLHKLVTQVKNSKEVDINYMKSWEIEQMVREDGISQGIRIGKDEGIQIGMERGKNEGIQEKTRTVVSNMIKRGATDEDIRAMAECDQELIDELRRTAQ